MTKRKTPKTITRAELRKLAFCNSQKIPHAVNDGGVRKEWIGIGWLEAGKPDGSEPYLVP